MLILLRVFLWFCRETVDFSGENWDFTGEHGDFTGENGDLIMILMGFNGR